MNRVSKGWDWLKRGKGWVAAGLKRRWAWLRQLWGRLMAELKWELRHVPLRFWLLALLPWALFTGWVIWYAIPDGETAFWYLLSALSQGMAAVLALTFTISLVAAQLSARYSYRLIERLLTPFTIGYILLFSVAVVLPLVSLPSPTAGEVKLSLSLGALALALLVPYLRYFLYRIRPAALLEDLDKAMSRHPNPEREGGEIETIHNMSMTALDLRDYDTFRMATGLLTSLYQARAASRKSQDEALERLRVIGEDSLTSSHASSIVIRLLRGVAIDATRAGKPEEATEIITVIFEIGLAACTQGRENAALEAAYALFCCGTKAVETHADDTAGSAALFISTLQTRPLGQKAVESARGVFRIDLAMGTVPSGIPLSREAGERFIKDYLQTFPEGKPAT